MVPEVYGFENPRLLLLTEVNSYAKVQFSFLRNSHFKILLIKNKQSSQQYDLLTYKILENRNPAAFPDEVIYRDLYIDNNNKRQDVKLKILQNDVFFSALLMESNSL